MNNYPPKFSDRIIEETLIRQPRSLNQNTKLVSAPHIKVTTEQFGKILKKYDIRIGSKLSDNLKSHLKADLKDKIPPLQADNVVYKTNCKDCPSVYYGETSKNLSTRTAQHQQNIRSGDQNSQIFNHISTTNHSFDLKNPQIVAQESRLKPRKFLESYFSLKDQNSINRYNVVPASFLNIIQNNL